MNAKFTTTVDIDGVEVHVTAVIAEGESASETLAKIYAAASEVNEIFSAERVLTEDDSGGRARVKPAPGYTMASAVFDYQQKKLQDKLAQDQAQAFAEGCSASRNASSPIGRALKRLGYQPKEAG